jgi:endonuclease YncB( thermonuclease family)
VFGNILRKIAYLPLAVKVLLAVGASIVLFISVAISALVTTVAFLALIVAVLALIVRVLQRQPSGNWGSVALASLLLVIVYGGITGARITVTPEQASSPSEPKEEAESAPSKTSEESAPSPKTVTEHTPSKATSSPSEPEEEDPEQSASEASSEPEEEDLAQSSFEATTTVVRIVDGDTVDIRPAVEGRTRVRLIGVDTPETRDPDCGKQPYSDQATAFTTSRLQGQEVGLEFDVERTNRYGRLLAYAYPAEEEMFNETLLKEGYAQVATFPPNVKYVDRFLAA